MCIHKLFSFTESFLSFFTVFLLLLFLPLSSENVIVNGTRGAPWLWPCQHIFPEPFQPNDSFIYWQSLNNTVLHAYVNGKEESIHQNQLFKNKTKIFADQLPFGNFSLVIDPLTLNDNTSLEVIFVEKMNPKRLCPVTVYVAGQYLPVNGWWKTDLSSFLLDDGELVEVTSWWTILLQVFWPFSDSTHNVWVFLWVKVALTQTDLVSLIGLKVW